jgi:hypothetical protein
MEKLNPKRWGQKGAYKRRRFNSDCMDINNARMQTIH